MGKVHSSILYQLVTNMVPEYIAYSAEIKYVPDIFMMLFENPTIAACGL